jgi:polyisoprenoid-binding protein YceI
MASEASDAKELDDGLRGTFGFEVAQFPTAHFLATSFTHKTGNDYIATGTLTIRGVTKPVTLPFTLTITGKTAHLTGTAQLIRTDFHVGEGEWSADTPVSHAVTVTVDLTATRL